MTGVRGDEINRLYYDGSRLNERKRQNSSHRVRVSGQLINSRKIHERDSGRGTMSSAMLIKELFRLLRKRKEKQFWVLKNESGHMTSSPGTAIKTFNKSAFGVIYRTLRLTKR